MAKIIAYNKFTGEKVRVPEAFVDLFDNIVKTPQQKAKEDQTTTAAAKQAAEKEGK